MSKILLAVGLVAPTLAIARITFSPLRTQSAADVVQPPAAIPTSAQATCLEDLSTVADITLEAYLHQVWERVNQAPLLELHHLENTHGEGYNAIEQYARPDQFRRIIYSERYPGSDTPIAESESVYVGDYAYERLSNQSERWFAAPGSGYHISNTRYWHPSNAITVSALRFTGRETLESGVETCVYAYQRTVMDQKGATIETSAEVLWVGIDDGYPHQWQLEKVHHHLSPPRITERTTTFRYPNELTIQIPSASLGFFPRQ